MTKFITLAGRKQTGKDTSAKFIADIIYRISDKKCKIVHFADALKIACSTIFGIVPEDMETEAGKRKETDVAWPSWYENKPEGRDYMTVREVLQFVGTEMFRHQLDEDIWVKSVFRQKYDDDDIIIIADCRFPNEADYSKEHGLLLCVKRDTGLPADAHASELALDEYSDYHDIVDNNHSLGELYASLVETLSKHGFLKS